MTEQDVPAPDQADDTTATDDTGDGEADDPVDGAGDLPADVADGEVEPFDGEVEPTDG